jgi:hypothetical protein
MPTSRIGSSIGSWCGSVSHDTSSAAEAVRVAAIRARTPEARLRDALELSELVHAAAIARYKARYPERSLVELAFMVSEGTHTTRAVR